MADLLLFRWKTTKNVLKSEAEIWPFCACAVQSTLYYPYLWWNVQILALNRKSGSRNMMVMSDFRPEVEIWPFCACAVHNMLYYPYLWRNVRNSCVIWEIGVEEHDGDVRFQTGSRNLAVSRMRSKKYAIKRLFMAESPKFPHPIGNRGRGTWWRQILNRKWKYGHR